MHLICVLTSPRPWPACPAQRARGSPPVTRFGETSCNDGGGDGNSGGGNDYD